MRFLRSSALIPARDSIVKPWLAIVGSLTSASYDKFLGALGCVIHLTGDWMTAFLSDARWIKGEGYPLSAGG